jgi:hypothetical protein
MGVWRIPATHEPSLNWFITQYGLVVLKPSLTTIHGTGGVNDSVT